MPPWQEKKSKILKKEYIHYSITSQKKDRGATSRCIIHFRQRFPQLSRFQYGIFNNDLLCDTPFPLIPNPSPFRGLRPLDRSLRGVCSQQLWGATELTWLDPSSLSTSTLIETPRNTSQLYQVISELEKSPLYWVEGLW